MDWLRLTGLSVGSLTTTILLGVIVGYLLSLKEKEKDTWCLIGYMASLFVLILAYTLRYSVYHPVDVWFGQMANLVIFGGIFLIQFAYAYHEGLSRTESRVALVVSIIVATLAWMLDFFSAGLPGVPFVRFARSLPGYGMAVSLTALAGHLWAVVVLFRKSRIFARRQASGGDPGRLVRSTRNLALLFGSTAAVAATHVLFRIGVISRTGYVTIFNIGSLLVGLLILVVYVNNSPRPVSFLMKIVGVSLATVLVSLGLAATAMSPVVEHTISDDFAGKAERAAAIASGAISGISVDPAVGYVIDSDGRILYADGSVPAQLLQRAAIAARFPSDKPEEWGSRLSLLEQYDAGALYLTRLAEVSGEVYRVGISYGAYRLVAHRFWIRLALLIAGTSVVIIGLFPLFFGRSLLLPIRRLIEAVEQVTRGEFETRVPVVSEDETGRLSRAYNTMIDSLRQAEGSFRALAENANDAILLVSAQHRVLYANSRARDLIGAEPAQLVGSPIERFLPGALAGFDSPDEREFVRSDGRRVPVEVSGGRTEWHDEPAQVVIIRDVSERKAAEATVRDQQQQILQADKLASIGVLVAGVAHEVHNPNQVIALRSHVLAEGLADLFALVDDVGVADETVRIGGLPYPEFRDAAMQGVNEIRDSTVRINKIVGELKGYVRAEGAVPTLTVEVNEAVRTVVNMCSHLIRSATDAFRLDLSAQPLEARMGKTELEQVILNLVQNACHALRSRDAAISVATAAEGPDHVRVVVADEGAGMSGETLVRIFDPLFTTKRDSGGTGLGLSVSRRLVRQAGGELTIESDPGRGTRCIVELDMAPVVRSGGPEALAPEDENGRSQDNDGHRDPHK